VTFENGQADLAAASLTRPTGLTRPISGSPKGTGGGPFRFAPRRGTGQNETLISPGETKRFAGHVVSHWNRYERRIRRFAELFVFKGFAPLLFRRFHGAFVFNGLAPLFVSPEPLPALRPRAQEADAAESGPWRPAMKLTIGQGCASVKQKYAF
jgi:hypothetical protein